MKISFFYKPGRERRVQKYSVGESASEFFYGALELQKKGHEIVIVDIPYATANSLRLAFWDQLFKWQLTPSRVYGGVLFNVRQAIRTADGCDVMIGTTPGIVFALAIWKLFLGFQTPIVGILLGLTDYYHNRVRKALNRYLLKKIKSLVFSEKELHRMFSYYRLDRDNVVVNQFGVDTNFWSIDPKTPENDYVLAVGNDSRRDYDLILDTAHMIRSRVMIITNRKLRSPLPSNVELRRGSWHEEHIAEIELRNLYQQAKVVVVPLVESVQPSGQSVTLQAMACGKPVVLTRTRGLWSETMMQGGENIVLVEPGDRDGVIRAINGLLQDPNRRSRIGHAARETVIQKAAIDQFAERLEQLCVHAISDGAG